MNDEISYDGISEEDLLVGLYHGTRPLGMGVMHDDPRFDRDKARDLVEHFRLLGDPKLRFDYVKGRPIKVTLDTEKKTIKYSSLYDRDAGKGRCAAIVEKLRTKRC